MATSPGTFYQSLQRGRVGESAIAKWLNSRGWHVLPVYEIEINEGKGPRVFSKGAQTIAPDMLVFKANDCLWIEAKHKTAFTWHRITARWTTGIDIRHYIDYQKIQDTSPWEVWLLFLHDGGQAKDSPPDSPDGLFGNPLKYLIQHENHRSPNWGKSGMVYWAIEHLKQLATLEDVRRM